eukprot:4028102-Amphidinium_carterae.2
MMSPPSAGLRGVQLLEVCNANELDVEDMHVPHIASQCTCQMEHWQRNGAQRTGDQPFQGSTLPLDAMRAVYKDHGVAGCMFEGYWCPQHALKTDGVVTLDLEKAIVRNVDQHVVSSANTKDVIR